ncbi:MAG: NAD(P)/FAD-dependent oxidoreductase [Chloroflexota bacterium]
MANTHNIQSKHIVVIGAGLAGLAASYDLLRAGLCVTLLEAAPFLGGLASSFQLEGQSIERFYHFICRSDWDLTDFIHELGLDDKLHWRQTHTAFFHNNRLYSFGTPFDLLRFSAVPWLQRMRFGLHIVQSRYRSQWRWLDQIPAKPWLIENIGEQAYNVIWHPLLRIKFGEYHDRISAAWVWHRIWRVARSRRRLWERESFGYLENGSTTLVNHLTHWLESQPSADLHQQVPVQSIEILQDRVTAVNSQAGRFECDAVLSTLSLPAINRLLDVPSIPYFTKASQIQYIGVVCAIMSLKRSFSRNFWMNINDPHISFNGIIEQTNLNRNLQNAGLNLIYIPFYLPTSEPRYGFSDAALFDEYIPMLKQVNPAFDESWIKERFVFRTPYAQAICTTGFAELMPGIRSPLQGLYLTDSTQFYPEDRTISAAIRQGRAAAQAILEDLHGAA